MFSGSNVTFERRFVNGRAQNQTTSEQSTTKLFKAIDDENLGDFERALAEGANVNAFNEEGSTPLMSIITNLSVCSGAEKEYQSMISLLLLHRSIDVNIHEECNGNTALHLAMCFQQQKVLQLLLSHPRISIYLPNKSSQNPEQYARRNRAEHLIIEIQKAQTGRQLLNVLSRGNCHEARRTLLNQDFNPNCWKRNSNGEIETPLSLIIKSCLQGITEDNKEVLTKLLKHKELDFSQIKPIAAIEQNSRLKQIIEQTMKERLANAIRKDLDDVKKLVEDNCFMNDQIVIEVLKSFNPFREYLNEKFPATVEQHSANAHNVAPEINYEFITQELQRLEDLTGELERTKAQLTEKEQELNRVVSEKQETLTKFHS